MDLFKLLDLKNDIIDDNKKDNRFKLPVIKRLELIQVK